MDVSLPDGTVVQGVPDGTTRAQLAAKLQAGGHTVPDEWLAAPAAPAEQPSLLDRVGRQAGLTARAVLAGNPAMSIPAALGDLANTAINKVTGSSLGMPSQRIQAGLTAAGLPAPETTGERLVQAGGQALAGGGLQIGASNVLAQLVNSPVLRNVLATLGANPGAQAGALASGGVAQQGAAEMGAGPGLQAVAGIAGAMAPGLPAATVNALRPSASPRLAQVQSLADQGVQLTPGQIAGGVSQRIEDAATSIPFVGDAIKEAQKRGVESFDRVAINKALTPIGKRLPTNLPAGRDAIEFASDQLGQAYDTLLPRMYGELDGPLQADLARVKAMGYSGLAPQQAGELARIIDNEITNRFTPGGRIAGETVKEIESELGGIVRDFGRSDNYDVRKVGRAAMELQDKLRDMLVRVNPGDAAELKSINKGYANLLRAQTAGARIGAKDGVFTPNQYQSAVRELDPSKRKAAFAKGDALGQDLSDPASAIMPQTVGDSGTALRYLVSHPVQGSLGAVGALPTSLLYSQAGLSLAQRLLLGQPSNALAGAPAITNVLAGVQR